MFSLIENKECNVEPLNGGDYELFKELHVKLHQQNLVTVESVLENFFQNDNFSYEVKRYASFWFSDIKVSQQWGFSNLNGDDLFFFVKNIFEEEKSFYMRQELVESIAADTSLWDKSKTAQENIRILMASTVSPSQRFDTVIDRMVELLLNRDSMTDDLNVFLNSKRFN